MGLAERKAIEVGQKLDSLAAEFKDWHDRSEERQLLQKNYTQIRWVTAQLDGFRQRSSTGWLNSATMPTSRSVSAVSWSWTSSKFTEFGSSFEASWP
jgi:hypothetical protein